MAINPIAYTEKIVRSFLKYQLTAYPFADPRLHKQMRELLNLERTRQTPLLRGPYVSLSRGFKQGAAVSELIRQGIFHPHMRRIIPASITYLFGHQEKAIHAIHNGKTTLVSTGTGSGKTECFLYPVISKCLEMRDSGAAAGVLAVIVYPMNALAEDQLDRMRGLLAGSGVTFGMYIGKTPKHEREVSGHRLQPGSTKADYEAVLKRYRDQGRPDAVHPAEEICSRQMMRTAGHQPRILLTNAKQLELLLTRQVDVELFDNAKLDFLVFDEAHTFTGIRGAETACLIRRLRRFCKVETNETVCIATSATIVDQRDTDAARKFATRFFGVDAGQVECVHEEYEADNWQSERYLPPAQTGCMSDLLSRTLIAVDADDPAQQIHQIYQELTGRRLGNGQWQEDLHEGLIRNELAYQIRVQLLRPLPMDMLIHKLEGLINRTVCEEELLIYLALGAAAIKEGRPVFRPVVHGFVRGIPGAVVTFSATNEPRLWLSSEDEIASAGGEDNMWRTPVYTCTTCGQHYYVGWLKDFEFTKGVPDGGQLAEDGQCYWEALSKEHGGNRVVLLDQVISKEEDDDLEEENWSYPLFLCRHCGSAHPGQSGRCQNCGSVSELVQLYAVKSNKKIPGYLSTCVSCRARGKSIGRRYREPIRPVRAVNVSDVHVLAQDMVHHAERKRLLLFADNRQDAAFQAGWMKDHARRFRLRRLMADSMKDRPVSIGDMVMKLDDELEANDSLSRALIPEVWRVVAKEGSGGVHQDERRHFLRIQVLREITTAANQQVGLEPWGRMKVIYQGLDAGARFIQEWSRTLGVPPEDLKSGIEALLDLLRRQQLLFDTHRGIFTRWWMDGDREIQRGYMPVPPGPKGMKLHYDSGDNNQYVRAWLTERSTLIRQIATKWGVADEAVPVFVGELWNYLTSDSVGLLVPVILKSSKDKPVANCSGVFQIASNKLLLSENHGAYRCVRCRRKVARRTPNNKCMAWQCDGKMEFVAEDPDNYNLQLLDEGYSMLRPEEHTAMVPQEQRERVENWFKSSSDTVNTLVCTPTLELGVDIGALDSILLRNVPPLPANYWQRAGRAGRRYRMAVNLCYCRPNSHDRSYFNEPVKMLDGRVDPPAFNLRNHILVAKHVHAAVITCLFQLTREQSGLPKDDRQEIADILRHTLPGRISSYLFESNGELRQSPFNIKPLETLIQKHHETLIAYVKALFEKSWPETDSDVVSLEVLTSHINMMSEELLAVLIRLRKRLQWAHSEIQRLNKVREQYGTLDTEDEAHYRRCDRQIKKLKGVQKKSRREAEGVDDINTYGVLAVEGFLPGYELDTGSVVGMAEVPYWQLGSMDFDLPRPTSVALREYVPGNLIYANSHKFVARRFHREAEENRLEMPVFEVNIEREALTETNIGQGADSLSSGILKAISVCDVDLVHQSQISDEEETRFQMPVSIYGKEKGRHNGGVSYRWGEKKLIFRKGVYFRMVNIGASTLIEQRQQLGYPICSICGQSVSPLASDRQIEVFEKSHEERCGRKPERLGFFADIVADCITIPDIADRTHAYSILEALRFAASQILDMHIQDLQIIVIGNVNRDEVDGLLWDPMPGGSGLLYQIYEHFDQIMATATEIASGCPNSCEHSCIDCLQIFRNAYYHKYLDRHVALEQIKTLGHSLEREHEIPPLQSTSHNKNLDNQPTNDGETKLKFMLKATGFIEGEFQKQIRFKESIELNHQIGSTTPDIYYLGDENDEDDKGACIYLDGMSSSLHGNPDVARRDKDIRSWLRSHGYLVIEITHLELDDCDAMVRHFKRLAKYLSGRELASEIEKERSWFKDSQKRDLD